MTTNAEAWEAYYAAEREFRAACLVAERAERAYREAWGREQAVIMRGETPAPDLSERTERAWEAWSPLYRAQWGKRFAMEALHPTA
jgi:hypothetical protein